MITYFDVIIVAGCRGRETRGHTYISLNKPQEYRPYDRFPRISWMNLAVTSWRNREEKYPLYVAPISSVWNRVFNLIAIPHIQNKSPDVSPEDSLSARTKGTRRLQSSDCNLLTVDSKIELYYSYIARNSFEIHFERVNIKKKMYRVLLRERARYPCH